MPNAVRYPRGYIRTISVDGIGNSTNSVETLPSDPLLANLYKLYTSRSVNADSWEFRALVIQRCSQLFGRFYHWLWTQLSANDCIYDFNLDFLYDTVNYIRTGKRIVSLQTWFDMLLEHPEEQHGVASANRATRFNLNDSKEFDDFISLWCAHPDGFNDMLCTAHVLFGVSKNPITTPA